MAGLTTQDMNDLLGLRMEDPNETRFFPSAKLEALNIAQLDVANLVHEAYLTEIEQKDFDITCALVTNDDEGSIAFSQLSKQPLSNGIQQVKIAGGAYASMMDSSEAPKTSNKYQRGTTKHPLAYVFAERIYVAADTDTVHIDVHYLREPEPMQAVYTVKAGGIANQAAIVDPANIEAKRVELTLIDADDNDVAFTADEFNGQTGFNKTQECNFLVYDTPTTGLEVLFDDDFTFAVGDELYFTSADGSITNMSLASSEMNPRLHNTILDMAEMHLWRHQGDATRGQIAYQHAIDTINALNQRYGVEAPIGIGTDRS